jgi:hypothetical protein
MPFCITTRKPVRTWPLIVQDVSNDSLDFRLREHHLKGTKILGWYTTCL